MSVEVKVGILFFLIAILAVAAGLFLTESAGRLGTYEIVVHFKDANGLAPGGDVLLAGVSVGKVASVELSPSPRFPEQPVAVRLALKKNASLFVTDKIVVDQGALLGDKYIAVRRPTQRELEAQGAARGPRIAAKADVPGGPSAGFANLSEQMAALMVEARESIVAVKMTYASPEIREGIALFLRNVNQASGQFDTITGNTLTLIGTLNRVVAANQGAVSRSMSNIETATGEIKATIRQVQAAVDGIANGPLPTQLLLTVTNLRKISEEVRASTEAIRGMVCDTQNQERAQTLLADMAKTAKDVSEIAASLKKLTTDEQVQGNLKATLENVKITTDNLREVTEASKQLLSKENLEAINATIANLRTMSTQGVEVTQKADQALSRVEQTMDQLGQLTTSLSPDQTTGTLRLEAARGEPLRSDLNVDLRYGNDPNSFWRVGARGVGASETLNLQRAFGVGKNAWVRAGIFGNKPGVAVDYRFAPSGTIELEAWQPGENRLDLRTYWQVDKNYKLTAGLESFLRDNDPFIGLERIIYLGPKPLPKP